MSFSSPFTPKDKVKFCWFLLGNRSPAELSFLSKWRINHHISSKKHKIRNRIHKDNLDLKVMSGHFLTAEVNGTARDG